MKVEQMACREENVTPSVNFWSAVLAGELAWYAARPIRAHQHLRVVLLCRTEWESVTSHDLQEIEEGPFPEQR